MVRHVYPCTPEYQPRPGSRGSRLRAPDGRMSTCWRIWVMHRANGCGDGRSVTSTTVPAAPPCSTQGFDVCRFLRRQRTTDPCWRARRNDRPPGPPRHPSHVRREEDSAWPRSARLPVAVKAWKALAHVHAARHDMPRMCCRCARGRPSRCSPIQHSKWFGVDVGHGLWTSTCTNPVNGKWWRLWTVCRHPVYPIEAPTASRAGGTCHEAIPERTMEDGRVRVASAVPHRSTA